MALVVSRLSLPVYSSLSLLVLVTLCNFFFLIFLRFFRSPHSSGLFRLVRDPLQTHESANFDLRKSPTFSSAIFSKPADIRRTLSIARETRVPRITGHLFEPTLAGIEQVHEKF